MWWLWKKYFQFKDIPDLSGKTAIITGSNTGIGRVCALEMARKNCTVILACRNEAKTLETIKAIQDETNNKKVEFIQLDLLSLSSVRSFVDTFLSRHDQLHILMNNAGVMFCDFALSKDGIESHFATNHVAHHYLTSLLLPTLERSAPSRVINVSSGAHMGAGFSLDYNDLSNPKSYNKYTQYGRTKACNILFTKELSRRLSQKGVQSVRVNCNHPGIVQSELSRHLFTSKSLFESTYNTILAISTEDGALTQLYLATSPEVETKDIKAQYYVPFARPGFIYGVSRSDAAAQKLWEYTENLLKEKVPGYEGANI